MSRWILLFICIFASGLASSCTRFNTFPEKLPLASETIYKGTHCGGCRILSGEAQKPAAAWITDAEKLEKAFRCMDKGQMPALSRTRVSAIDFSTHGILYVRMGRKTTGGYYLKLPPDAAVYYRKRAVVTLEWIEPEAGSIVTQAITHPCILIKLPKKQYKIIEAHDLQGNRKITLKCRTL
jgi:hypothetical protein